jgi:hypothetical protein
LGLQRVRGSGRQGKKVAARKRIWLCFRHE